MKKNIYLILIIIAAIAVVGFYYSWQTTRVQTITYVPDVTGDDLNQILDDFIDEVDNGLEPEQIDSSYQTITIAKTNKNYVVNASYPEFSLSNKEQQRRVNQAIKTKIDILINNFLDIADTQEALETPDLDSQTDIGFEVYTDNDKLISLGYSYYSYVQGAAHGFNGYDSFNYDLVNDQEIEFYDLFLPDTNFLEALSLMATEYFSEKFEDGLWFEEGVAPEIENFNKFVLTTDSLVILFDNYEVVTYVLGPQEWEINYEDIFALLDEAGPVKYFK